MSRGNATKGKGGFFVSTKQSFVRFDGSGMSVDMGRYLSTERGKQRFKNVAASAFRPKPSTGPAGKK